MIRNHHQIPRLEILIHTAGRIRQNHFFRPQHSHDPDRHHHIRHIVPFVVMNSSLHNDHRNLLHIAEKEAAVMACHGGDRKALDLRIGNLRLYIHVPGIFPQTGTEDQGHLRDKIGFLTDDGNTFLKFFIHFTHSQSPCFQRIF